MGVSVGTEVLVEVFVGIDVGVEVGEVVGVFVDVGVFVGICVAVGALAAWVPSIAAAACVALVSNSAWDGPQAFERKIITNPPSINKTVFFQFIDHPPKLFQV